MHTIPPSRRRWFEIGFGGLLILLIAVVALLAAFLQHPPRPRHMIVRSTPVTESDVKLCLKTLNRPDKKVGYVENIWVVAAHRLEIMGPEAQQFGAVEALEAFIAKSSDAEAIEAANKALANIKQ